MHRHTTSRYRPEMSDAELDEYVDETEELLGDLDPVMIARADRLDDLREIRELVQALADAEGRLDGAVTRARYLGRSWGDIAAALGVTRQSAHAKYAARVD